MMQHGLTVSTGSIKQMEHTVLTDDRDVALAQFIAALGLFIAALGLFIAAGSSLDTCRHASVESGWLGAWACMKGQVKSRQQETLCANI